jgi:hypothetical protein
MHFTSRSTPGNLDYMGFIKALRVMIQSHESDSITEFHVICIVSPTVRAHGLPNLMEFSEKQYPEILQNPNLYLVRN